jgi:hypothetical protein
VRDVVKELIRCMFFNPVICNANSYHSTAEGKRKELRGDKSVLPRALVDLPFPAGTLEMAKHLPSIVSTPFARITSPFVPQDS